jgi:hypothetical protein
MIEGSGKSPLIDGLIESAGPIKAMTATAHCRKYLKNIMSYERLPKKV